MDALSEIVDDVGVKAQRLRLLNHFQARKCITREPTVSLTESNTTFVQVNRATDLRCSLAAQSSRN